MRLNRDSPRLYSGVERAVTRLPFLLLILAPFSLIGCYEASRRGTEVEAWCETVPYPPHVGPVTVSCWFERPEGGALLASEVRLEANMTHPGMQPVLAELSPTGDSLYQGFITLTMSGDWYFTLRGLTADGQRFESTVSVPGVRARQ